MSNKVDKRITEQSSLYEHLEKMSVDELTAHINAENKKVAVAIEEALPAINQLISAIERQLKKVQNTYGIDGSQIQAIFPGGIGCLTQTRESREDDLENGWHQLCDKHISKQDFVLGFSGKRHYSLRTCHPEALQGGRYSYGMHRQQSPRSHRPGCRLSRRSHHGTRVRDGKYPYESRIIAEDDSGYDQYFSPDSTRTSGRQQDGERQAYQP